MTIFSVFLLTLVTPTAAANGTTTMSAGVPTIQVKEEKIARRDALWLCRYICVCATQRVFVRYIWQVLYNIFNFHVESSTVFPMR